MTVAEILTEECRSRKIDERAIQRAHAYATSQEGSECVSKNLSEIEIEVWRSFIVCMLDRIESELNEEG